MRIPPSRVAQIRLADYPPDAAVAIAELLKERGALLSELDEWREAASHDSHKAERLREELDGFLADRRRSLFERVVAAIVGDPSRTAAPAEVLIMNQARKYSEAAESVWAAMESER